MPIVAVYEKLSQQIHRLSHQPCTPNFQPHLTLLGNMVPSEDGSLIKTCELSSLIQPFEVTLTKIECLQDYFKSIFVRVEETETCAEGKSSPNGGTL